MRFFTSLTVLASLAHLGMALPYYPKENATCTTSAGEVTPTETALTAPPPCTPVEPIPGEETDKRAFRYGEAFIVDKDLYRAFTFISENYINHHPGAENGPAFAYADLSNIWPPTNLSVVRMAYKDNYSWLDYWANETIRIVDRWRWDQGCIVEHWDDGEVFPADSFFE